MSNARLVLGATATFVVLATTFASNGAAQTPATGVDRFSVPATVSPEAAAQLSKLYARLAHVPKRERPQTLEQWDAANAQLAKIAEPVSTATADALHVTRTEDRLGGRAGFARAFRQLQTRRTGHSVPARRGLHLSFCRRPVWRFQR